MWVQLTEEKQEAERKDSELNDKLSQKSRGRPEGGTAQAAKKLNLPGSTDKAKTRSAQRAVKIASIPDEAKKAARDAGLLPNHPIIIGPGYFSIRDGFHDEPLSILAGSLADPLVCAYLVR